MTAPHRVLGRHVTLLVPIGFTIVFTCGVLLWTSGATQATVAAALINLTLVMGLYIFVGNSGVLSFGHAALMAVGGYLCALLMMSPNVRDRVAPGWPELFGTVQLDPVVGIVLGGVAAALFAALIAVPLSRTSGLQAALATVALLLVVRTVLQNWDSVTGGAAGIAPVPHSNDLFPLLGWAVGAMVVAYVFQRLPVGLRLRASREEEVAARASGIRIGRERAVAWTVSGFVTGVGGALLVQSVGVAQPNLFYIGTTFLIIVMLIVGGMFSFTGAFVGTVLISSVSWFMLQVESGMTIAFIETPVVRGLRDVVLALVMLVVLLIRPSGVTGGKELGEMISDVRKAPTSMEESLDDAEGVPSNRG